MKEYIEKNLDNILNDLADLVAFNSENSNDELPFGSENRKVLDCMLNKMEAQGMKTKNLDYYCGYGEVGEGDQLVGILGHLDIVPAGDGWNSNPFKMVKVGNNVYGRGVTDDKGGVIAGYWALKYLMDTGFEFKKRFRLIAGCNEEMGSGCIKHYVEKEGHIDMGFTPDANFPGIYGEKGMIGGYVVGRNSKIIDIKGGQASNIVCKEVEATLPENSYDKDLLVAFFKKHDIKYELDGNVIKVFGKAAHGSMPQLGVNAISYLMVGLKESGFKDSFVDFYNKYIGLECHGESLGFEALKDDVTDTSINIGVIKKENGVIKASLDLRFPVTASVSKALPLVQVAKDEDNEFEVGDENHARCIEPLYFDTNTPFVKALEKAYRKVTGDNVTQMEAIGGGTYAKAIHNCIAFGLEWQGEDCHIHGPNEFLNLDNFKKTIEIYIEALKNLNEI